MTHIGKKIDELNSALLLQVSIISRALTLVTRSRSWSFIERPGLLLVAAFIAAQLDSIFIFHFELILTTFLCMIPIPYPNFGTCKKQASTLIDVYAHRGFARIQGLEQPAPKQGSKQGHNTMNFVCSIN